MARHDLPDPIRIPVSYKSGISLIVTSLPAEYALQGILFTILPAVLSAEIIRHVFAWWEFSTKAAAVVLVSVPCGLLGFAGTNGGTLLAFISDFLHFRRSRKTAYYNPRVKTEYVPEQMTGEESSDLLSAEGLSLAVRKLRSSISDASAQMEHQRAQTNASSAAYSGNLYFEEDKGIVEAPWEYRTAKERRRILRKMKQERRGRGNDS